MGCRHRTKCGPVFLARNHCQTKQSLQALSYLASDKYMHRKSLFYSRLCLDVCKGRGFDYDFEFSMMGSINQMTPQQQLVIQQVRLKK